MNFKDYQEKTRKEAVYPKRGSLEYLSLCLVQETGKISEEMKENFRNKTDSLSFENHIRDSFWLLTRICDEMDKSVEEIMEMNVKPEYYDSGSDMCEISSLINLKVAKVSILISKDKKEDELNKNIAESIFYLEKLAEFKDTNIGEIIKNFNSLS